MSEIMDPNYLGNEPNRVAEIYRNYRPIMMPLEVEKHLDFIDISEDGYTILGSSNLTGRIWRGSVWYYNSPTLPPKKEDCITGIECDSTVCDGKFIDNKRTIIVGEDSGAVTVYQLVEEEGGTSNFVQKNARHDHNSSVLSISVSSDKSAILTAGMDMSIKVWDSEELSPTHTFRCAHSLDVTGMAYSPETGSHIFASCGLDGAALLWDTRQPKPATVIVDDPGEGLTAVTWQSGDHNTLIIGSSFGTVSMRDIRTFSLLKQSLPFDREIYKLLSIKASALAVCANSHEVKVLNTMKEDLGISYTDERHTDFVRGLCYDNKAGLLYSCGWDTQVLAHSLP